MSDPESLAAIFHRLGITPQEVNPAEYQDMVQTKREAVWHRACQLGKCRYAVEDVTQANPPPVDSTVVCGGYHGSRHDVTGVWRWRPCIRHYRWLERRAKYLAETGQTRRRARRNLDDDGI